MNSHSNGPRWIMNAYRSLEIHSFTIEIKWFQRVFPHKPMFEGIEMMLMLEIIMRGGW